MVCFEPFSSVGKPLELWGSFPVGRNQFQGSHKCRFMLNIDSHQMKLLFPRYNQAHKTSGTNFQVHPSKIESLKEEMDEAGNKVEQCKVRAGWVSLPHLPWNCPTVQLLIMWQWHCPGGIFMPADLWIALVQWGTPSRVFLTWEFDMIFSFSLSQLCPGHEWKFRVSGCSQPWSSWAVGGTWRKLKLGQPRTCHSSEQFTFIFTSQQQMLYWVLRTGTIFISTFLWVL